MIKNVPRIGNFTSSEIVALVSEGNTKGSLGAPFYKYVEECNMERRLMRSVTKETNGRATNWGKLGEKRVFQILPTSYTLMGDVTIMHPLIDCWAGSPDVTKRLTVGDAKCPHTLESFCQLVDPHMKYGNIMYPALSIEAVRANHKDGEKYYWQIVSNAVLVEAVYGTPVNFGELIVYVPYLDELGDIRTLAANADADDIHRYFGIVNSLDEELPYLVRDGQYKNLNHIPFEIPQRDKDFLTDRVLKGKTMLIPFPQAA